VERGSRACCGSRRAAAEDARGSKGAAGVAEIPLGWSLAVALGRAGGATKVGTKERESSLGSQGRLRAVLRRPWGRSTGQQEWGDARWRPEDSRQGRLRAHRGPGGTVPRGKAGERRGSLGAAGRGARWGYRNAVRMLPPVDRRARAARGHRLENARGAGSATAPLIRGTPVPSDSATPITGSGIAGSGVQSPAGTPRGGAGAPPRGPDRGAAQGSAHARLVRERAEMLANGRQPRQRLGRRHLRGWYPARSVDFFSPSQWWSCTS
jgi:hypothetical protein